MTAINVICQNRHIHILSDGAHRDPEGKLVALGQKVFPLAALNSAIAVRGPSLFAFLLFTLIGSAGFDTGVDQMIDGLERTVRRANQHFDDWASKISDNHGADNHGSDNHVLEFELFVAGWSSKGGPESYFLTNHDRHGERFKAWEVARLGDATIAPTPTAEAFAAAGFQRPASVEEFRPEIDGLCLLEAQRRTQIPTRRGGGMVVAAGGFAQLTTVCPDHITSSILRRWPDQIGSVIASAA
jgi:hypothetical protein